VNQERIKLGNRDKSSNSNKYCDYCKVTGHITDNCWDLHPEKRPRKFEKGNLLRGSTDYESDGDAAIPYKYDEDERAICLALRDTGVTKEREVKYPSKALAESAEAARLAHSSVNHEKCFMARLGVTKST
jgi:hypothetical protein